MNIDEEAKEISEQYGVDKDQIKQQLQSLIEDFKVPEDEARRSIISRISDEGVEGSESIETKIEDFKAPEEWVSLEAKVLRLWESESDSIAQSGLIGDETGAVRFTSWSKSNLPLLEENKNYRIENAVTDEYRDRIGVYLNSSTSIEEIDKEINAVDWRQEIEGAIVSIQNGSGLIERCPQCNRVLRDGRCVDHGEIDGEFDLRVKAILDDGDSVYNVLLDRQTTEEFTNMSLEDAKKEAKEAMDRSIVEDKIKNRLLGRYFKIRGSTIEQMFLAEEVEKLQKETSEEEIDHLLVKARTL